MIEIRVPDEQEGTKAVVRAWLKRVGEEVRENDPLVELETDKVTQEVPAPAAGVLAEILLETDAEAVPGALLGRISDSSPAKGTHQSNTLMGPKAGAQEAKPADPSVRKAAAAAPGPRPSPGNGETRLSPSVKRACLQHGIDPTRMPKDKELDRLFEGKRADTGEAWSGHEREISAYDFTFSPHKSVTLAAGTRRMRSAAGPSASTRPSRQITRPSVSTAKARPGSVRNGSSRQVTIVPRSALTPVGAGGIQASRRIPRD